MSEPKRFDCYILGGNSIDEASTPDGEFVRYEDYARLKKQYDDLEYCRGHVPYAQHRSAVDKWTELFHKTADNFDKVVAENARLKAENDRLKANDSIIVPGRSGFCTVAHYLAEIARLKAEVERHIKARQNDDMAMSEKEDPFLIPRHLVVWWMDECKKAQAQVERLTKESDILQKCCEHQKNRIERLKQNEQLIDAGNALHDAAKIALKWGVTFTQMGMPRNLYDACRNWNAAKEGKQP